MYSQTSLSSSNATVGVACADNSSSESEISFKDIFSGNIVHIDVESLTKIDEDLKRLQEEVEQDRIKIQHLEDELGVMVDAGNFLLNINSIKQEKK